MSPDGWNNGESLRTHRETGVDAMSFAASFIVEDSARTEGGALTYEIRLPWYRSLPLSSLVALEVSLNGEAVPAERLRVRLNDKELALAEFAPLWDEYWFVQDRATVVVAGAAVGEPTEVDVRTRVDLRSPYIMIAPNTPLVSHVDVVKHLTVGKAAE